MTQYAKVTALIDDKRRTVRLEVHTDNSKVLTGFEVNAESEHVTRKTAAGHSEVFYVLSTSDIIKRVPLRMNLHYGELEAES